MFRKFAKPTVQNDTVTLSDRAPETLSIMSLRPDLREANESAIRARCQSSYLGDHKALCRVLGRYKTFVDTRDVGIAPHLLLDGYWEMWVTEALVSLVRSGMVVADIGANLGYFTLLLADLVGPNGRVHAFEPNPNMVDLLQNSLSVNGFAPRVRVSQVALADRQGQMEFIVPYEDPKNARLVPAHEDVPHDAILVPCERIDGRPEWSDIELAKVDVEGAEKLVWAGAKGLLDSGTLKTVILEFEVFRNHDAAAFLEALIAPGFSLSYVHQTRGIIDVLPAQVMDGDPHADIMLVLRR